MQTSVIGFPRVGALRELKFTTEKFFKGLVSEQELQELAKDIRKKQWLKMQQEEVDFIPSNDFSFYDNFLDTAVLFNIIPDRYRELSLSPLEKYFACLLYTSCVSFCCFWVLLNRCNNMIIFNQAPQK